MTAAEQKIILEIGSDYRLQLKVKQDDGINDRDLTGWGFKFVILKSDGTGYDTIPGIFTDGIQGNTASQLTNGECTVSIDAVKTEDYVTGITGDNIFDTEFNYFYTLTLYEDGNSMKSSDPVSNTKREMRVMRGKLAIRI